MTYSAPEQQTKKIGKRSLHVLIAIVDDDTSVREAVQSLLKSIRFRAENFSSAEDFLQSALLPDTTCLILDVRMAGMGGLELQRHLAAAQRSIPIIFISAHEDENARTQALLAGAVDFLAKLFSEDALLSAVHLALGQD